MSEYVYTVVAIHQDLVKWLDKNNKPGQDVRRTAGDYLQKGVECARNHRARG